MISLALVLSDTTEIRAKAQPSDRCGAIAVVELGPAVSADRTVLQTSNTAVFRQLAAALLDSADRADALTGTPVPA